MVLMQVWREGRYSSSTSSRRWSLPKTQSNLRRWRDLYGPCTKGLY